MRFSSVSVCFSCLKFIFSKMIFSFGREMILVTVMMVVARKLPIFEILVSIKYIKTLSGISIR